MTVYDRPRLMKT